MASRPHVMASMPAFLRLERRVDCAVDVRCASDDHAITRAFGASGQSGATSGAIRVTCSMIMACVRRRRRSPASAMRRTSRLDGALATAIVRLVTARSNFSRTSELDAEARDQASCPCQLTLNGARILIKARRKAVAKSQCVAHDVGNAVSRLNCRSRTSGFFSIWDDCLVSTAAGIRGESPFVFVWAPYAYIDAWPSFAARELVAHSQVRGMRIDQSSSARRPTLIPAR